MTKNNNIEIPKTPEFYSNVESIETGNEIYTKSNYILIKTTTRLQLIVEAFEGRIAYYYLMVL